VRCRQSNPHVEEYLSSGVIRLHVFRTEGSRVKAIEILKMRGVKHDETCTHMRSGKKALSFIWRDSDE